MQKRITNSLPAGIIGFKFREKYMHSFLFAVGAAVGAVAFKQTMVA